MGAVKDFNNNFERCLKHEMEKLIDRYANQLAGELIAEYGAKLNGEMRSIAARAAVNIFKTLEMSSFGDRLTIELKLPPSKTDVV